MLNLTLRQLRTFLSAAHHLSFARAAEELHLTPPAVSMQIRDLEKALGLAVFERNGRNVVLTPVGEYLVVGARRVSATLREVEDTLARLQGLKTGRVTVGALSTAQYFLPRMLARFRDQHPGVEVRLQVGNREQIIDWLRDGELDLAVMGRPPRELEARAESFADHPIGVIAAAGHPLATRRRVGLADLEEQPFIVRERGSGTRLAMEQFFRERHVQPPIVMEMTSNESIKQAVIANMGLAFLSLHTVGLEREAGLLAVLDIPGTPLPRSWHLVSVRASGLSPAADAFRYFMLERAAGLLKQQFGGGEPAPAAAPAPRRRAPAARKSRRRGRPV